MSAVMSCAGCGAPLVDPGVGERIVCGYCRRVHTVHRTAPAQGRSTYTPGQPVLVHWGSTWWDAHVQEVVAEGAFRIRYDGYSSQWDEVVGLARIRPRAGDDVVATPAAGWSQTGAPPQAMAYGSPAPVGAGAPQQAMLLVALAALGLFALLGALAFAVLVADGRNAATSAGVPAAAPTVLGLAGVGPGLGPTYAPGQPVSVLWQGTWYDATVLVDDGGGRTRIHYDGWSSSWDEDVTPDRIRPR